MDIASLKLQLVQNILKIDNADDLNSLEEVVSYYLSTSPPKKITYKEFQKHIDMAESDFETGRVKESDELLEKYSSRHKQ